MSRYSSNGTWTISMEGTLDARTAWRTWWPQSHGHSAMRTTQNAHTSRHTTMVHRRLGHKRMVEHREHVDENTERWRWWWYRSVGRCTAQQWCLLPDPLRTCKWVGACSDLIFGRLVGENEKLVSLGARVPKDESRPSVCATTSLVRLLVAWTSAPAASYFDRGILHDACIMRMERAADTLSVTRLGQCTPYI